MMNQYNLSILGAGHLAKAFISGLLKQNFASDCIHVSNRNVQKLKQLNEQYFVKIYTNNCDALSNSSVVILGVKPSSVQELCDEIRDIISLRQPIIISLAASITCTSIRNYLNNQKIPIIRAMCNTPMEFNQGFSALYSDRTLTAEQHEIINSLFAKVGTCVWIEKEEFLDPLTIAVGSAPAYVLICMRALKEAAESLHLPEELAKEVTVQILKGAAALAESSSTFEQLQNAIATSGGVTEHSLKGFDQKKFLSLFEEIYHSGMSKLKELKN